MQSKIANVFIYSSFYYFSLILLLLAAIVCPVVNTGVFVVCMLTFFMDVLSAWAEGGNVIGYIMTALVLANFVPELIINIAFSPASVRISGIVKK